MDPEKLREKYVGCQVVMVTPFKDDYSLDEDGIRRLTNFLIKGGVQVLQPCGSTGEFWSLTPEEHKKVIKIVVDEADGRIPVVPGTSHSGTKLAVVFSKYAEEVGADGVMIVPPYYHIPTLDGIYEHYKTVAEAIKIGIVIYNNPFTSKITIREELMEKLATIPNVVAVKDTTADMQLSLRLLRRFGDRLTFSMGSGEYLAAGYYLAGGKGHVSSFANFAPALPVEMYKAAKDGDWEKVKELDTKMAPFFELRQKLSNKHQGTVYITLTKEACRMLELPGFPTRKPLLPLKKNERQELRTVLAKMGILK
jgi:4-hydroxy-tetrahydrodipicolinate synthase